MPTDAKCAYPPCDRAAITRGMCPGHYQQTRRGTPLHPLAGPSGAGLAVIVGCTVDGCPDPHKSRGLCSYHYNRAKRGLPLTLKKKASVKPVRQPRPRKPAKPPVTALPKGWDRPLPPKRERTVVDKTYLGLPPVAPMNPLTMAACLQGLRDNGAEDLIDALGVSPARIRVEASRWAMYEGSAA